MLIKIISIVCVLCNCPGEICDAIYDNALAVLRDDDGDIITPLNGQSCTDLRAVCMGDSCMDCKCPSGRDTFNNHREKCENINGKSIRNFKDK